MSGPAGHLDLATYLNQLRIPPDEPSLEPELDDKDEKKDKEMRYACSSPLPGSAGTILYLLHMIQCIHCREAEDLANGCVMTGTLEQGTGSASPVEGDMVWVFLRCLMSHPLPFQARQLGCAPMNMQI